MKNRINRTFLAAQLEAGLELAAASDLLELIPQPEPDGPPRKYLARFHCRTFVRSPEGNVTTVDCSEVGLYFPPHYLWQALAPEVITWIGPNSIWHPNIRPPYICVGDAFLRPGTRLVEILHQLHSIISFQRYAAASPMNDPAGKWVRHNQHLLPADPRPLKRRKVSIEVTLSGARS